jgi:2-iminobutanoate/2-iminopropanoate deaminase
MRRVVESSAAPRAIGPYSQAVATTPGEVIYTSGQIPLDPATGAMVGGTITEATERVMLNLEAVLREAGCTFEHVVKSTIFLTDLADFAAVNEVYGKRFPSQPPARSTVQVAALPKGAHVEIELVAVKG